VEERIMVKTDELYLMLKKIDLFSSLDKESLKLIENNMKKVSFDRGDYICKEGESGDRMYIIASGKVRVLKKGKGKSLIEITELKAELLNLKLDQ
jgi:CRP-like cAMP-binding protein